jgi:hypothetical protein
MAETITKEEAIKIAGKELVELAEKENCECTSNPGPVTVWKADVENDTHRVTAWYLVDAKEMKKEADSIDWDEAFEGFEVETMRNN